jgi:hypothetical protein
MAQQPSQSYGHAKNLFVMRKASGDAIVVGGFDEHSARWTRILSQRAAQMLLLHLTQLLFPDQSEMVIASISTAPLRGADLPTITTHMAVDRSSNGAYEITGWVGSQTWGLLLDEPEAQTFWKDLDGALASQGSPGKPRPPTP